MTRQETLGTPSRRPTVRQYPIGSLGLRDGVPPPGPQEGLAPWRGPKNWATQGCRSPAGGTLWGGGEGGVLSRAFWIPAEGAEQGAAEAQRPPGGQTCLDSGMIPPHHSPYQLLPAQVHSPRGHRGVLALRGAFGAEKLNEDTPMGAKGTRACFQHLCIWWA